MSAQNRQKTSPPTPASTLTMPIAEVIEYNLGDTRPEVATSEMVDLISLHYPRVLAVVEGWDKQEAIREAARHTGYILVQRWGTPGAEALAMLVHPRAEVVKVGVWRLSPRTYVGRNVAGSKHSGYAPAKALLWVRFKEEDGRKRNGKKRFRTKVRGVCHLVPSAMKDGNWQARALHNAQTIAAAAWLRTRKADAVLTGDFNAAANHLNGAEFNLLKALRKVGRITYSITKGSRAIDFFVTPKGQKRRGWDTQWTRSLGGYKSDHRPTMLYRR